MTCAIERWALINHLHSAHGIEIDYEQVLANNFSKLLHKGDAVVDVGAHSGRHTRVFADLVGSSGRICAIEPLEYFATLLSEEFKSSNTVRVHNVAASNFIGTSSFTVAEGTPEESGLRRKPYIFPEKAAPKEIEVPVVTLDSLLSDWNRVDYLKLDIEGAELDCLEGGTSLIRRTRPIISFECGIGGYSQYGKTASDFITYAKSEEFQIYDLFGQNLSDTGLWHRVVDNARTWDFYYVPNERRDWFESAISIPKI